MCCKYVVVIDDIFGKEKFRTPEFALYLTAYLVYKDCPYTRHQRILKITKNGEETVKCNYKLTDKEKEWEKKQNGDI